MKKGGLTKSSIGTRVSLWALLSTLVCSGRASAEVKDLTLGAFSVRHSFSVPGDPGTIYDAMTGEIGAWWDHSFTEKPKSFRIEAKVVASTRSSTMRGTASCTAP